MHLAAQNGHLNISKLLVEGGSNMDYQDLIGKDFKAWFPKINLIFEFVILLGNTPLHTAVHTTHTEIAKFLVASGANENKKNLTGLTPFQLVG